MNLCARVCVWTFQEHCIKPVNVYTVCIEIVVKRSTYVFFIRFIHAERKLIVCASAVCDCILNTMPGKCWTQFSVRALSLSFCVCVRWPFDGRRIHRSSSLFRPANDMDAFFLVLSINYSFLLLLLLLLLLVKVTFVQWFRIKSHSVSFLMNMNANNQKRKHSNRLLLLKLLQLYCFVVRIALM